MSDGKRKPMFTADILTARQNESRRDGNVYSAEEKAEGVRLFVEEELSHKDIAEKFDCAKSTVEGWVQKELELAKKYEAEQAK